MSDSTTWPAGTHWRSEPTVAAAVDRWVAAAANGDDAEALAGVVALVAAHLDVDVGLEVDGMPVAPSPAVVEAGVDRDVVDTHGAWLVGFLRESLLAREARRVAGVHHTSPGMARTLVELVTRVVGLTETDTILDPSCGGGAFLLAVCETLGGPVEERIAQVRGFDIDPLAVAATSASLRLWGGGARLGATAVRVQDALAMEPWPETPSVVIGNPPFLSQLRGRTARDGDRRAALRARWPVLGGYADDAAAFLLAAVDGVADGGVVALVQPSSFLSARDAEPVRRAVALTASPAAMWIDGGQQFAASVDTVAVVVRKADAPYDVIRTMGVPAATLPPYRDRLDPASWAPLLLADDTPKVDVGHFAAAVRLADVAGVTAGFRDQFYGLRGAVSDDRDGQVRLITSGLIDPLHVRWGDVACRFDRQAWSHPSVDPDAVAEEIRSWVSARLVPKLLVAGQTKVIEAVIDPHGRMVPCTPVVSVEPVAGAPSLAHLAAALTSPVTTALMLSMSAGSALSRDAMRVSATLLGRLPLPTEEAAWDDAAAAVEAGLDPDDPTASLDEIGRLGLAAYGLGDRDDLLRWWRRRRPRC